MKSMRLLVLLAFLATAFGCQDPLHRAEDAPQPAASATPGGGGPATFNPATCDYPVFKDFFVGSTCARQQPCTFAPTLGANTVNSIRWRVGSACGDYYYSGINGAPYYRLYKFVGGSPCERFQAQGGAFSCLTTNLLFATTTLMDNTRYFIAVSNTPFAITDIYKDADGWYHANSCSNNTTWGISDFVEFTTGFGRGFPCRIRRVELPTPE